MLKEAYAILAESSGQHMTPHAIEKHMVQNSVLTARVKELFTNYRQQWRNPSTHDHRMVFNDQEAFLAIVSVSAFANILIDQMLETASSRKEASEVEKRKTELARGLSNSAELPLVDRIVSALTLFAKEPQEENNEGQMREVELLGRLTGFMSIALPSVQFEREVAIDGQKGLRVDLVAREAGTNVVLELKRSSRASSIELGLDQVKRYLEATSLAHGILFLSPAKYPATLARMEHHYLGDQRQEVHVVASDDVIDKYVRSHTADKT